MKILPLLLLFTSTQIAYTQSENQRDLIRILEIAFQDGRIPEELIQKPIENFSKGASTPFIIVKSDKSKSIESKYPSDDAHVWVVDYTEIFAFELTSGLVPLILKRKKKTLTIEYKTVKYPYSTKENTFDSCHAGRLVARKYGESWKIVDSDMKEIKCEVDMYSQKK